MLLDLNHLVKKYNMVIQGVAHIGAHFGEENLTYDQLKIKNRIFFEPLINNFEKLKQNISEDFLLFNIALGNENKDIEMYVETENLGQSSSILKPALHLIQYPHITFNHKEVVKMYRLDDLKIDLENINFINIDVQGYELEVFKGAEKTLKNIDYIMSEINRDNVYENCVRVEELKDYLSKFEFKLVEEYWAGGTWGDGLFIKNNLL